jgi:hypothetical protein
MVEGLWQDALWLVLGGVSNQHSRVDFTEAFQLHVVPFSFLLVGGLFEFY